MPSIEAEVRLPRPPGVIRRAFAAHPRAVDVSIVVCYLFGCFLMAFIDSAQVAVSDAMGSEGSIDSWFGVPAYLDGPIAVYSVFRVLVVSAALFFRRRFPLTGLIAVSLMLFGDHGAQMVATSVAQYFLLYAVPVYRSVAAGWVAFGIALSSNILIYLLQFGLPTPGVTSVVLAGPSDWGVAVMASIMNALWLLAVMMLGVNLGNRRRYLQAIIDRAHQLARERDQLAQLAVAEERSRIAREMHDIVAHSVSVMIALSEGASRAVQAAPDAAAEAMQRSAETGRTALAEMRRLLGALQASGDDAAELAPQPVVADIPELVQGFRDAGLSLALDLDVGEFGDRGQELAIYRVVQESLTNVLRYAGLDASAMVGIRGTQAGVIVHVRDYGRRPGSPGPTSGVGSGRGLAGLAERVRVFGGRIESGPAADGPGWIVEASFPVHQAARQSEPPMPMPQSTAPPAQPPSARPTAHPHPTTPTENEGTP